MMKTVTEKNKIQIKQKKIRRPKCGSLCGFTRPLSSRRKPAPELISRPHMRPRMMMRGTSAPDGAGGPPDSPDGARKAS